MQEQKASSENRVRKQLLGIYDLLDNTLGDLGWWPAETREEIMIGALLVQNVSWSNTVKALDNLRDHDLLNFQHLYEVQDARIEKDIKSTRFYRSKTQKLKALARHVVDVNHNDVDALLNQPMDNLRNELLGIHGIGPETADDIVLYAAGQPSFVIDAYTKRIFSRLGLIDEGIPYHELRAWFMRHLPNDTRLFNQYHAWLDAVGHYFCRTTKPKCPSCPLESMCQFQTTELRNLHQSRQPGP